MRETNTVGDEGTRGDLSRPRTDEAATAPYTDPGQRALRQRMRRQLQLMLLIVAAVLTLTFSVPFILRYLNIAVP